MKNKKTGIIFMEVLLLIVLLAGSIFGMGEPKDIDSLVEKALGDKTVSTNKTFTYALPNGYIQSAELQKMVEGIALKEDGTASFTMDVINYGHGSVEEFINSQENTLKSMGKYEELFSETEEKKGEKITKKIYQIKSDMMTMLLLVGVIEFDKDNNSYIGVIGTANEFTKKEDGKDDIALGTPFDIAKKDFEQILSSVKLTDFPLSEKRVYSYPNEKFEITVPPYWERDDLEKKYSFYKEGKNGLMSVTLASVVSNDEEKSPEVRFEELKKMFLENTPNIKIYEPMYDKNVDGFLEEYNDTTLNGIVYEYTIDGKKVYSVLALIKFKKEPNLYAVASSDLILNGDFEKAFSEVKEIFESVKLRQ